MVDIHLHREVAVARLTEVLEPILSSEEWRRYSREIETMPFIDAFELFRRFFDVYEGGAGEAWLGIMENMVVEEMRLRGEVFAADPATIEAIVMRIERHPNVSLER